MTRRLWQVVPESMDDSAWVGMEEAGQRAARPPMRRHQLVIFSNRQGLHGSHGRVRGVVVNHHGNQQRGSKMRRQ